MAGALAVRRGGTRKRVVAPALRRALASEEGKVAVAATAMLVVGVLAFKMLKRVKGAVEKAAERVVDVVEEAEDEVFFN